MGRIQISAELAKGLSFSFVFSCFPKGWVDRFGNRGKSSLVAFPWCLDQFLNVSRETLRVAIGVVRQGAMFHVKRKFGGCAMRKWFHVKHVTRHSAMSTSKKSYDKKVKCPNYWCPQILWQCDGIMPP